MLKFIDSKKMGRGKTSWLDSHFHFSFADYYNPNNINFGVLRVINDDLIKPNSGFDTHPHKNMEIISYVVEGEITHEDSMQNTRTLTRGQVQYMSAGTGVLHSEYNLGKDTLRLLQIWIMPDKNGHTPNYGDYKFSIEDRENKWLLIASDKKNQDTTAPVLVNADINLYATILTENTETTFKVRKGRQAYLVLIEGDSVINGISLRARDALEIVEEEIFINTSSGAHILLIEMAISYEV